MENTVSKYLKELGELKREVTLITMEMSKKSEEYEFEMKRLSQMLNHKKQEIIDLQNSIMFAVRLGDLLQEISFLSGIKVSDISVKLETNVFFDGKHDFNRMFEYLEESKSSHFIRMEFKSIGNKSNVIQFDYFAFLPLDFDEIQADGHKLIDHCSLNVKGTADKIYTEIDIDRNIEDVILSFDLSCLEYKNTTSWYPADLFSQALVNCVNNYLNPENSSVLKRKI